MLRFEGREDVSTMHIGAILVAVSFLLAPTGCDRFTSNADETSANSDDEGAKKTSKKKKSKSKKKRTAEVPPEPENGLPRMAELKKRAYELGWRLNDEKVDVVTEGRNPYHQHSVTLAQKGKLVLLQVQKFETDTVAKMHHTSKSGLAMRAEGATLLKVGIIPQEEGEAFLAELID